MTVNTPETKHMLAALLQKIGLSEKEEIIYTALLTQGKASPGELAKKTKLKRGITYVVLNSLVKKGLISMFEENKKTHFQIENPRRLLDLIEQHKQEVDTLEHSFKYLLPKLISQFKLAIDKPTIRFFEGQEGIKEVFDDIYGPKETPDEVIYGCVDFETADTAVPGYIGKKLIPKRIKNKIMAHSFIANSPAAQEAHAQDTSSYRKSVLLDKSEFPMPAEIDVYEDKIAMLSFEKSEFIGILIENAAFAESLRSIFKLAHQLKSSKPIPAVEKQSA